MEQKCKFNTLSQTECGSALHTYLWLGEEFFVCTTHEALIEGDVAVFVRNPTSWGK